MQTTSLPTNRLADSTSPYLLQHADNPVDWWPWCDEALAMARRENKPILLSIGYSACHWCHVMAHESFEDPATAEQMNRLYVNIKVDREERPDLDKIYQSAHQLLARRPGGWPLTLFLTPDDRIPFFAGTYFPPQARHGLPAFADLLQQIERAYRQQHEAIQEQNQSMLEALDSLTPNTETIDSQLDGSPQERAVRQLAANFDAEYGGFGQAPKFPHPSNLEFLLHYRAASDISGKPDPKARHMALFSVERMIEGGMNDQLGGGFCRYSTDAQWMIPHFEKMLYDNGPLLSLCCDAWLVTGREPFRHAAQAIANWVMREMQATEGGYYSSLDADSEGEEGRYYVWDADQVRSLLSPQEFALIEARYSDRLRPNFEGKWHLHGYRSLEQTASDLGLTPDRAYQLAERARGKLLAAREERVRPGRDEKILCSWNALMIRGMARAARMLQRDGYLASAEQALAFIRDQLWRDGRLLATSKDGRAHLMAYLDDHAFLLDALLELLQTRWNTGHLHFAIQLADTLLERFEDPAGGFFFTADDHETLIHRPKPLADEAMPSGNGVAALALLRLGHILGENRYLDSAERCLKLAWPQLQELAYAHAQLLMALNEWLNPGETLVIRAAPAELGRWTEAVPEGHHPQRLVLAIPDTEEELPGLLGLRSPQPGGVAYLCRGTRCDAPLNSPEALSSALTADQK